MGAYLIPLVAGILITMQTSSNTRIGQELRSPYISGLVNFVSGALVLTAVLLIREHGISIPFSDIASKPLWIWSGGMWSTIIVLTAILCLPVLGSARIVMIASTGQILTGLALDHFGLMGSEHIKLTALKAIGALLVVAGVILASYQGKAERTGSEDSRTWFFVILAFVNGVAGSSQIAANGALNKITESAVKTAWISMAVGLFFVILVLAFIIITRGKNMLFEGGKESPIKLKWWMIAGGTLAVTIIGLNAVAAPMLGTGAVTIMNLTGMMVSSLAVDATGFLGIDKKPVTLRKVAGMAILLAGAMMISLM